MRSQRCSPAPEGSSAATSSTRKSSGAGPRLPPAAGNSGYFVLLAPESAVEPGESLELRVTIGPSKDKTWFMVKDYADTIQYEQLSGKAILDAYLTVSSQ